MDISVTPPAEKFIKRLLRFDGGPGSGFRLQVTAGGCSGLAAEFSVEAAPRTGDAVVEVSGIKLFLPAESRLLLDGVTIDFAETPTQSGFVFHDPKKKSCGCGPNGVTVELPGLHKH
ncbi:MAG: HesB/IscA family protein [Rhodomicrobium sp.]